MGIFKDALKSAMKEAIVGATVGTGLSVIGGALSVIEENTNKSQLSKMAKENEYCLFVDCDREIGEGIYRVYSKKKEELYSTLLTINKDGYSLAFYDVLKGKIGSIQKKVIEDKSLFSKKEFVKYSFNLGDSFGDIIITTEGKKRVYKTSFNSWIAMGDFNLGKYRIIDTASGKTIGSVINTTYKSKRYGIVCEDDDNKSVLVFLTIFIDHFNKYHQ